MIRAVLGWVAFTSGVAVGQFLDGFAAGRAAVRESQQPVDVRPRMAGGLDGR